MSEKLISVIMSTYNETSEELEKSISSILNQSYKNIEVIIIDDNPNNEKIKNFLKDLADNRIHVIYNDENIGLVASLNKALRYTNGEYIARMDADDIAIETRLEREICYLINNNLDLVGTFVTLIDEKDTIIKPVMRFPTNENEIRKFIKWGNCLAHPTWLAKKEVFKELNGYRKATHCEDYDFILRALKKGYKIANLPEVGLKYRIRNEGISRSNRIKQYLLRNFLSDNRDNIDVINENDIEDYLGSQLFVEQEKKVVEYFECKQKFRDSIFSGKCISLIRILVNRYFWKDIAEKITLFLRER